uniref:Uncharacterized protein n=1 Tax=Romanomermis culicivorax TaxID=13658 RepID=A0A915I351_ROMCU
MKHLTLTVSSVEGPQISTNFSHVLCDLLLDQHVIILSLTFSEEDFYHKARVSGLLLCVGIGSYLAYRLCLKIFNCDSLTDLLAKLKSALSSRSIRKLLHCDVETKMLGETGPGRYSVGTSEKILNLGLENLKNCSTRFGNGGRTLSVAGTRESNGQTFSVSSSTSSSSSKIQYYFYKGKKIAKIDSQTLRQKFSNKRKRHPSSLDSIFNQQQQQSSKNCRNGASVSSPHRTFCGVYDDDDASTVDQGLNNLNSTRKSVSGPTPICRTNALSDDDCRVSVASSSTSTNSRSPPPIERNRIKNDQDTQFDDKSSVSVSCVSSSVQQDLIWDNICTPCSTESKKLFEFDHPLALKSDLFDRALLNDSLTIYILCLIFIQLDLSPDARADSPGPSEWSEVSSYAANVEIGNETIGHFTLAENILVDTRRDFDHFATDFARSFDQRRLDWLSSVDYSRRMYCSVTVQCHSTTNTSHNASPQGENCSTSEVSKLGEYPTNHVNITDSRLSASSRGEKRRYAHSLPCEDHEPINGKKRKRHGSIPINALENQKIMGNLRSCSRLSNDSEASDYWSYYSSSNDSMFRHSGRFKCCEICRPTRSTSFPVYVVQKSDRTTTTVEKHKCHFSDFNISDETSYPEGKNFFTQSVKRGECQIVPKERASLHFMTMSSSFEDSCLSSMSNSRIDQSASTSSSEKVSGVSNNSHQWRVGLSGHKFEPSLDVTPEVKDYENEGSCYSRASSVRPDSLQWDEFDPDQTMKSVYDDLNNNEKYSTSSQYNFLPIPCVPDTPSTSRVVNLLDFVKATYPTYRASHEDLRKLARHDGLYHVRRPSTDKESLIESFLFHAQRSNIDLFDRCSFLHMKAKLQTLFVRHKSVFDNLGPDYSDFDRLSRALEVLWNFQNNNSMMTSFIFPPLSEDLPISEADDGDLVKAIKILLILRIVETHDRRFLRDDNGNVFTYDYFYNELFNCYTLTNLASLICGNGVKDEKFAEFLLALLADAFHLMINVFRFTVDGHIFNDNYHRHLSSNVIDQKMQVLNFGRFEIENSSTELFLAIF